MVDEYKNVLCDACGEALDKKAYRVDLDGCYCIACALHTARENLTNTGKNVDVCIDKVDTEEFIKGYI